jgi:hypothetical protein
MRCFLSHSSSDKSHYVQIVADKLGDRAVYDKYDFDAGMPTLEEIYRGLGNTDIFVVFLSDASLNSEWVKREISDATKLLGASDIKRFLPLLIDKKVNHRDPRIPEWIRENFNLRLVAKPNVALRHIRTVFNQLALAAHPRLDAQRRLFVGRNQQTQSFENRLDDYSMPLPAAIIISGLREIGRKSFIINALRKANKISLNYNPIVISIQQEDGLDGVISKIYDAGIYDGDYNIAELTKYNYAQKVQFLIALVTAAADQNEIILVDDWRCIVRYGGTVAEWLIPLCEALPRNRMALAIACASRPKLPASAKNVIFSEQLPELEKNERMGLLVRYLREIEGVDDIKPSEIDWVRPLLNGYPEQAIYAGQIIAEHGFVLAQQRAPDIRDFTILRAGLYVEKFLELDAIRDFLVFLSWFDFVSFNVLVALNDHVEVDLIKISDIFIENGICSQIGGIGEYLRLNDVIRDYVARGSLELPAKYSSAMLKISRSVFSAEDLTDFDYSETFASVRVALLAGKPVPERLLIPAHFLGAIAQAYKNRKYTDVIELSDRVLALYNVEKFIEAQVRHYLCMALARRRSLRFLGEVMNVKGAEHNYIMGFYYRISGRYTEAIERFEKAIEDKRWAENAKREIVLIYNITENYAAALELARQSYSEYHWNAITIQAYFEVLLNLPRDESNKVELASTLQTIRKLSGPKADEVRLGMEAKYQYHVEKNSDEALRKVEEAIERFSRSPYPLLAKLEIALAMKNVDMVSMTIKRLEDGKYSDQHVEVRVKRGRILLNAYQGKKDVALSQVDSELGFIHPTARERLRARILSS